MFRLKTFAMVSTLMLGSLCGSAHAQNPGPVKAIQSGDWHYRCTNATPENCEVTHIAQMIQDGKTIDVLTIAIARDKATKNDYLLAAIVPFHDVAPRGIDILVDGQALVTVPYHDCSKIGCRAQTRIGQASLQAMQRGLAGEARLHFRDGKDVGLKFSLTGLTKALAEL